MVKKQTKIVATVSDLNCSTEFIKNLHENGVDVIRLNTAHQGLEDSLKVVKNIRKVSERIAILIDTKGPEIRTCSCKENVFIKKSVFFKVMAGKKENASTSDLVYVTYKNIVRDVPIGAEILIDDGEFGAKVIKKSQKCLICQAINDGKIKKFKSVNIPNVSIKLPSLSQKDKDYILFAIKHDIDFIAHSFVRNKKDIEDIQTILNKHESKVKIIAKIENREGVDNIDEIIDACSGIMVARGDLGIEIPAEEIPLIQKDLIKKCIEHHKPVIVATQMMHSMIKNPRPTRAEVSDVANAVLDGTDAVMLSGETAFGDYPIEAVKTMVKIIKHVERDADYLHTKPEFRNEKNITNYLIKSAVSAAKDLDIKEIILSTDIGFSAEIISSYRSRVPVFVKCFDERVVRELALAYGVNAHKIKKEIDQRKFIKNLLSELVRKEKLKLSDKIIYLSGDYKNNAITNFMEICEVGKYIKNTPV